MLDQFLLRAHSLRYSLSYDRNLWLGGCGEPGVLTGSPGSEYGHAPPVFAYTMWSVRRGRADVRTVPACRFELFWITSDPAR
jgi:hypothetical protein